MTRSFCKCFRDPRAFVFGLAVFGFSWICWREPEWTDYKLMFLAVILLAASFLILVRRVWSNFVAAALGGYLPVQFVYEFWTLPRGAEVPPLSLRHFDYFIQAVARADGPVLLFFALSILILTFSVRTLKRLASA